MKTFGIRCGGLEEPVENLIKNHANLKTSDIYTVIEIGTAGATTLRAFYEIVKENRPDKYLVCGFDLLQCGQNYIKDLIVNFNGRPNVLKRPDLEQNPQLQLNEMYLLLLDNPQEFIERNLFCMVDYVHIDGCHCYKHVIKDFLCVENKVKTGGLVTFHDAGAEEEGTDLQHGDSYINVREAIRDLGLFDNKRNGWKFVAEIPGSRVTGMGSKDGNSLLVVEKL